MTPEELRARADDWEQAREIAEKTLQRDREDPAGPTKILVGRGGLLALAHSAVIAPDLARLGAKLGEALREIREQCRQGHGDDLIAETTDLALAKLAELKMP